MRNTIMQLIDDLRFTESLTPGLLSSIISLSRVERYEKRDLWLSRSERRKEIGLLKIGSAMLYRYELGKQNVICLWSKNDYLIEGSVLLAKSHPADRIEFLEPSDVIMLDIQKLRQLKPYYAQIDQLIEALITNRLEQIQSDFYLYKFRLPHERLKHVKEFKKNPFNRLTVMQKASYLGISKQSLYNLLYNSK